MCGIVGVINLGSYGLNRSDGAVLRALAMANMVRGDDGTGVFCVDLEHQAFYDKKAVPANMLYNKVGWEDTAVDMRAVVVHNRAATMGHIDDEHTHPFVYGSVVGVHNGTVQGWSNIGDAPTAKMDSMAIIEALSNVDVEPEEVVKILQETDRGAYSLVWYDMRNNELRFARNNDRPMHMVRTTGELWFGSEIRMLEWALARDRRSIVDSWSNESEMLLCIPLDASTPAYVHQYEARYVATSSWRGNASRTVSSYASYWDDDWDGDDWWSRRNRAASPASTAVRSEYPTNNNVDDIYNVEDKVIAATDFGVIPMWESLAPVRPNVYKVASAMLGCGLSSSPLDPAITDLRDALYLHWEERKRLDPTFDTKYEDVDDDNWYAIARPVIVYLDRTDKEALGFIKVGGHARPIRMKIDNEKFWLAISATMATDRAAILPFTPVEGITLYNSGEFGYIMADTVDYQGEGTAIEGLERGDGLFDGTMWKERQKYGWYHPLKSARRLDSGASWKLGWDDNVTKDKLDQLRVA